MKIIRRWTGKYWCSSSSKKLQIENKWDRLKTKTDAGSMLGEKELSELTERTKGKQNDKWERENVTIAGMWESGINHFSTSIFSVSGKAASPSHMRASLKIFED